MSSTIFHIEFEKYFLSNTGIFIHANIFGSDVNHTIHMDHFPYSLIISTTDGHRVNTISHLNFGKFPSITQKIFSDNSSMSIIASL